MLATSLTIAAHLANAGPLLTLDPVSGAISGLRGQTIGWGFSITNTTDWLLVTSASFSPAAAIGTFIDYTQSNFVVVGPAPESTTVTQAFDTSTQSGIGSFTINPAAPFGIVTGEIFLTYDLYSEDPNSPTFDPTSSLISTDNSLSAPASVQVVPEPATWLGMISALVLLRLRRSS
jgi:hypothetical protein